MREARVQRMSIELGTSATLTFTVSEADTATALGSGDVPVLATPRALAWLEAATVAALAAYLDPASTSVGTRVELEHVTPTAVGRQVQVTASVSYADGRLIRFEVALQHRSPEGDLVVAATGRITRVIVDRKRFLDRHS